MSENQGIVWGLSKHLKKYLLAYTIGVIMLAIFVGHFDAMYISRIPKQLFTDIVMLIAVATVYPSMIQLKGEALGKAFKEWKSLLLSLVYVFALAPLMAYVLAPTLGNRGIGLGFMVVNVVPAGSASVGYVLIAEGSIELATALAILGLVVAIPAIPLYLQFYGRHASLAVPISPIMSSILYILVLPLVLGQVTRIALRASRDKEFVEKRAAPYLSSATIISLFALVFVLVMKEANFLIAKPYIVGAIITYQAIIILGTLSASIMVSEALGISYEDHQAIAFTSTSKNQSVAAAIAMMALNPAAAVVPALIPMIQPVLAMAYIYFDRPLKNYLRTKRNAVESD
ncbi:MAG TPA: arsenic resistance protein [Thermoprotei archaeon]|nr:arsenic resistance protein [Thermoprotei archaeon]